MHAMPKGLRLHIALFGRRNAGKSSLLNALAGQEVAIVANTPGTTTDPVEKTMERSPARHLGQPGPGKRPGTATAGRPVARTRACASGASH